MKKILLGTFLSCSMLIATAQEKNAVIENIIKEANENAEIAGVTDQVTFIEGNLFDMNFSDATVLTLYLLPNINLKLRPKILKELKPGTRIVSHAFDMGDWKPEKKIVVDGSTIYYWTVPER